MTREQDHSRIKLPSRQQYRPEIDGLRCLSVLAVFAFHASLPVSGGYIGVDVFFVISGFLITGLITAEIDRGVFSFRTFYARRIVRIVPALLLMTVLVFLLGTIYLYPAELTQVAVSAMWTTLSFSNVFFYVHLDYFDSLSRQNPLLHTWSLGVEEQFYLIYPLLLVLLLKTQREAANKILIAMAVTSLAISAYWAYAAPSAAYYLLPSRFWELLLGGLTSIFGPRLWAAIGFRFNPLPAAGLVVIGAAAVLYTSATTFPGLTALPPCLGCCFILADTRSGSWTRRLLAAAPLVYVGKISYSLYLWHWPLITFQRVANVVHTGYGPTIDKVVVVALIFLAADLSYRFVETPLRRGANGTVRERRALAAIAGSAIAIVLFAVTMGAAGFPARYSPATNSIVALLSYDPSRDYRLGECFLTNRNSFSDFKPALCLNRPPNTKSLLLVGDSHAAELYSGLRDATAGTTTAVLQATATGCKPLLEDISHSSTCGLMNDFLFNHYLPNNRVDTVMISARWDEDDVEPLAATLAWLRSKGLPAVVLGPTPEYTQPLPRLLAASGDKDRDTRVQQYLYPGLAELDRKLAAMTAHENADYISMYARLCPGQTCDVVVDNAPVYFDSGHFTPAASSHYATEIMRQIDREER